jgi:alkanesulfonate monooxygenase SsuD/methylene tetrahydromethanopterin reductase-like flavin-dependent oxidoreductase (luciferase family)
VPFVDRGPRYEDGIRALRAAFGRQRPAYAGTHHRFADVVVDPCGVQAAVPIWLGGRSARSLRRALALADGWDPFGLKLPEIDALLARARDTEAWGARRQPFDLVLPLDEQLDPSDPAERSRLLERLEQYRALGATIVHLRFRHASLAQYLDQLEAVAAEVAPRVA